jgi:phosphatidylglycerophosphatase A
MNRPNLASTVRSPALLLATWGGMGLSPFAPGTVGSLAALPLCVWALHLASWWVVGLGAGLWMLGVWSAAKAGAAWGQVDHPAIVIDEVLGQLIAMAIPWFWLQTPVNPLLLAAITFALFRLFDITKPWPVSYFDRVWKSPAGVMFDDVVAGVLAGLVAAGALSLVL